MTGSNLFELHRLDDWNQPVTIANPWRLWHQPQTSCTTSNIFGNMFDPFKKNMIWSYCIKFDPFKKIAPILITPVIGFSPIFRWPSWTPKNTYPSLPTSCRLTSRLGYWQKRLLRWLFSRGWLNCGTKNAVRKSGILLFFTPCYFLVKMLVHLSFASSFDRTTLSSKSRTTNFLKTIQHVLNHESIIGSEVLIPNEW